MSHQKESESRVGAPEKKLARGRSMSAPYANSMIIFHALAHATQNINKRKKNEPFRGASKRIRHDNPMPNHNPNYETKAQRTLTLT